MPSPISPQSLADLVPPRNGSFCGRFIPGIINWMTERANFYRWMYKDSGDLTVSFLTDLCIAKNGTVVADPSTCPPVAFSAKVLPRHQELRLTFTGVGLIAGYAYSLFRSTSVSGPWGAAITTGTTTSAVISYTDITGLVNDTTYYYKLTVTKPGCPATSFQTSGVPKLCLAFDFQLTVSSSAAGVVTIKAANVDPDYPMDNTFTYSVLANGSEVSAGTLADHSCTLNESPGLCLDIGGVAPGAGTIITVAIREKVGCAVVQHSQTLETVGTRPAAPSVLIANGNIIIQYGASGALPVAYRLRRRAVGACRTDPGNYYEESPAFAPNAGVNAVIPVTRSGPYPFTCTQNVVPPTGGPGGQPGQCVAKYEIWAFAFSADGGMSDPSAVVSMNFPSVPLWPGQC